MPDFEQLLLVFVSIIYEALPFVVLGVILAGILEEFIPQQWISILFEKPDPTHPPLHPLLTGLLYPFRTRFLAIGLGGILGLVFPMCECGIVAVMRRLIRKGVPLSVCICYMLAGPVINVVVMLSTYVAFNYPREQDLVFGGPLMVVGIRVGLAFAVAFVTSLLVEGMHRREGNSLVQPVLLARTADQNQGGSQRRPLFQRLGNISETALHDFIDIMTFLILGAGLAAVGRAVLAQGNLEELFQQNIALSIVVMMGIAILFCLCSEADAFVAANFAPFWPPAAKMAFLVLGPMLDIKLLLLWTRIFRMRLIVTLVFCLLVQVFLWCLLVHYVFYPETHGYPPQVLQQFQQ